MDQISNLLNSGWFQLVAGLVGGFIISYYINYLFYRRGKSEPRLIYQYQSRTLLGPSVPNPDIEIIFRGKKVPRVTKSLIALWNDGNTTIDGNQIVQTDPIRLLVSSESEVLEVKILRQVREVNNFVIQKSSESANQVECHFEWLDPRDGVLIAIVHSGERKVSVAGTIRGVPSGLLHGGALQYRPRQKNKSELLWDLFSKLGVVLMFVFVCAIPIIGISKVLAEETFNAKAFVVFGFCFLFLLAVLYLGVAAIMVDKRKRVPPEILRIAEGDW
jgi:hypothetical protein